MQTDGASMGLPLGPILADIFMIKHENSLLPYLTKYITCWKRYVDDKRYRLIYNICFKQF